MASIRVATEIVSWLVRFMADPFKQDFRFGL
jgi:hypothetical protein